MSARHHLLLTLWLACGLGVSGCAQRPLAPACPDRMTAMTSELLYFGTSSPRGPVTPAQWTGFLERNVAPRFPDGFTVWQADGQWRGESGEVEREGSYVLNVVHAGGSAQHFAAIIDAYKTQFQQEAVLRVQGNVCVSL
jgi:hypothetical protein